jgi:LysR family cys regulon transcriptional activator
MPISPNNKPKGHPLEGKKSLSPEDIAEYPIVTYHEGFTGRKSVDETFSKAGITPDIVMSALDADVIKTYVELGLGIGIIASMAYQAERDTKLSLVDAGNIFETNTTRIALRKGYFLRGFTYEFIGLCIPNLDKEKIIGALKMTADNELD